MTAVCETLSVPTLILHRAGDQNLSVEASRELKAKIPNARYVELEGVEHIPWVGDSDSVLEEIEEFVTGLRHRPEVDRVLSTILVTDIVESTQTAADSGTANGGVFSMFTTPSPAKKWNASGDG